MLGILRAGIVPLLFFACLKFFIYYEQSIGLNGDWLGVGFGDLFRAVGVSVLVSVTVPYILISRNIRVYESVMVYFCIIVVLGNEYITDGNGIELEKHLGSVSVLFLSVAFLVGTIFYAVMRVDKNKRSTGR